MEVGVPVAGSRLELASAAPTAFNRALFSASMLRPERGPIEGIPAAELVQLLAFLLVAGALGDLAALVGRSDRSVGVVGVAGRHARGADSRGRSVPREASARRTLVGAMLVVHPLVLGYEL